MIDVEFSHRYKKMPSKEMLNSELTHLLAAIPCWKDSFSASFIEYDTAYEGGHYPLPEGKWLLLLFGTGNILWTTVRRWDTGKEAFYKRHLNEAVNIKIVEENDGNNSG
jgi:hypothetical protein